MNEGIELYILLGVLTL